MIGFELFLRRESKNTLSYSRLFLPTLLYSTLEVPDSLYILYVLTIVYSYEERKRENLDKT